MLTIKKVEAELLIKQLHKQAIKLRMSRIFPDFKAQFIQTQRLPLEIGKKMKDILFFASRNFETC